jgi:hypothetical protein
MPSYGGTKGVDWKTGQVIEGSSATTKAGSWKGTGRRITGWKKKKKKKTFLIFLSQDKTDKISTRT